MLARELSYCREGYKSLHEKASSWSELVCFLNQHIKAHSNGNSTDDSAQVALDELGCR